MKKLLIVLSVFALGLTSCNSKSGENVQTTENGEVAKRKVGTKLRTASDSLSYAVGVDYGRYLKSIEGTLGDYFDEKMVIAAIRDVLRDQNTLLFSESRNVMQDFFMVRIPERNRVEGEKFMEEMAKKDGVQKTESGLLYEIIEPGSDKKATSLMDEVRVKYRGTLKDGTEFDSNYEKPDTAQFVLNRVVKGWGEGLQLIGEGGKIKLYIPSELGYGKRGGGPKIGANEPLVFDVDLIEVVPAAVQAPAEEKK